MNTKEKFKAVFGSQGRNVSMSNHQNTTGDVTGHYRVTTNTDWTYRPENNHIVDYNPMHIDDFYNQRNGTTGGHWNNGWNTDELIPGTVKSVPAVHIIPNIQPQTEEEIKFYHRQKNVPNKLDKDLIDSKLPYNIKKDNYENIIYEIGIAGYTSDRIFLQIIKDGFMLKLFARNIDDDLIGEDYIYICQGLKETTQEINIYIDSDEYSLQDASTELENGMLSITVPKKSAIIPNQIPVKGSKSKKENIQLS